MQENLLAIIFSFYSFNCIPQLVQKGSSLLTLVPHPGQKMASEEGGFGLIVFAGGFAGLRALEEVYGVEILGPVSLI